MTSVPFLNCTGAHILIAWACLALQWSGCKTTITSGAEDLAILPSSPEPEPEPEPDPPGINLLQQEEMPPANLNLHYHFTDPLMRKYGPRNFIWTGSGEGPIPDPGGVHEGGLAWEDNGPVGDTDEYIRITKTMVLFKTVLSTVYTMEMTPSVVISPTPRLGRNPSDSPSSSSILSPTHLFNSQDEYFESFQPSHYNGESSKSATVVLPSPLPNHEKTANASQFPPTIEPSDVIGPNNNNNDERSISPENKDPLFLVQTIIKANDSVYAQNPDPFEKTMEKNLAMVYACAFKRHLMSSLGIFRKSPSSTRMQDEIKRRKKRSELYNRREDIDFDWIYTTKNEQARRVRSLAVTSMNVTVSIVNITGGNPLDQVSLNYIIYAEGNPVAAASAVHELELVTKSEMEKQIGYQVINKAEALIASPLRGSKTIVPDSPWLTVAMVSLCCLFISILIIVILIWKWNCGLHSAESESTQTLSQMDRGISRIEVGSANPAFDGPMASTAHAATTRKDSDISQDMAFNIERNLHREQQRNLALELNKLLMTKATVNVSPLSADAHADADNSNNRNRSSSSCTSEDASDYEDYLFKSTTEKLKEKTGKQRQTPKRARRVSPAKKTKRRFDSKAQSKRSKTSDAISLESSSKLTGREETAAEDTAPRNVDKITYGDLDVCEESMARPMSSKARNLLQKNKSLSQAKNMQTSSGNGAGVISDNAAHAQDAEVPAPAPSSAARRGIFIKETPVSIDAISDPLTDMDEKKSICEQDRDLSESFEHIPPTAFACSGPGQGPSTRDVEVQTPEKMKPKSRRKKSGAKLSTESLISTKSEEVLEVHEVDSFSASASASDTFSNPIGKMRQRFHQFLDDAFNVIEEKKDDEEMGRSKSAKVSISHHVKTLDPTTARPSTSYYPRENTSLNRLRPKSATFIRPRQAWGSASGSSSTKHKSYSARSDSSSFTTGDDNPHHRGRKLTIFENEDDSETADERTLTSTIVTDYELADEATRRNINRVGYSVFNDQLHQQSTSSGVPNHLNFPGASTATVPVLVHEANQQEETSDHPPDSAAREKIQIIPDTDANLPWSSKG